MGIFRNGLLGLRHRGGGKSHASARPRIEPGPREELWLVLGPRPGLHPRGAHLAGALERSGKRVVWGAVADGARAETRVARTEPAGVGPSVVLQSLRALRELLVDRDEQLRVLVEAPSAQAVALVREAQSIGARVLYDAPAARPRDREATENERALVRLADDLIGPDRSVSRAIAGLADRPRMVHLLPNPEPAGISEWQGMAGALAGIAARPTVAVFVHVAGDAGEARAAIAAFLAARGDLPYKVVVVAAADHAAHEELDKLDEAGEIHLLRCAAPRRAAAWNLALRATTSEMVVLADTRFRPSGVGWLEAALRTLAAHRDVGAVGEPAEEPGMTGEPRLGWWRSSRGTRLQTECPPLCCVGLVAPRAVLARAGGVPEVASNSVEEGNPCERIGRLGYRLERRP